MNSSFTDNSPENSRLSEMVLAIDEACAYLRIPTNEQLLTGADILKGSGRPATSDQIVLQLLHSGDLQSIRLEEIVDLALGKKFVLSRGDRMFRFTVDTKQLEWPHPRISGELVRELAQIPADREVTLVRKGVATVIHKHDFVDLAHAGVEQFITKVREWKLKVQGVELDYSTPEVRVGSAMERAGLDPKKAWHIYLMVEGQPKQEVSVDYIVDLRTPGIEKIRLMQRNVDNGDGQSTPARRLFKLLKSDAEYLDGLNLRWETMTVEARRWLLIHDYPATRGYSPAVATLALDIPVDYPASQIDMFYFAPWVVREDGVVIPNVQVRVVIDGIEFQGWSRHRNSVAPWDPASDNIRTHLALVESCLAKELGE
jgi:hypothetical protein